MCTSQGRPKTVSWSRPATALPRLTPLHRDSHEPYDTYDEQRAGTAPDCGGRRELAGSSRHSSPLRGEVCDAKLIQTH
jgi:hypothetical protein